MVVSASPVDERPSDGYQHEPDGRTVDTLLKEIGEPKVLRVSADDIAVDVTRDREIKVGQRTCEATPRSITTIGNFFGVPSAYLDRCDEDLQELILGHHLKRAGSSEIAVAVSDTDTIAEVYDPRVERVQPRQLVQTVASIVGGGAQVLTYQLNDAALYLDVVAHRQKTNAWGGDPQEGDLTGGGLRIGQDRKSNTAPWVEELLYRLVCTNGMEVSDPANKVTLRGKTVPEVLVEFEEVCERAFSRVSHDIEGFYELREVPAEHPEQTLMRFQDETTLPNSVANTLVRTIPTIEQDEISMFDLVNLVTNQANDPKISSGKARRALQQFAGSAIADQRKRCSHCQSAVV